MKRHINIKAAATTAYLLVGALFLAFFLYIGLLEGVSIYRARSSHTYASVEDCTVEKVTDETAPAGVRTVYRWVMDPDENGESCLCFFTVHHCVEVYFGEELVYSLTLKDGNRLGKSPGSSWAAIPVYPEDSGKAVTVILTPLFESVIDYDVSFMIGSHFGILFDQIKQELPQLFLALLCVLLGLFIILMQLYFALRTRTGSWEMVFLGIFSVMLGLWRFTYAPSAPILFPDNPMLLGYITIGTLLLVCSPLLLFCSSLFSSGKLAVLPVFSLTCSGVCLLVLLLQVLGIAEFKETLTLSHIMLISTILGVPAMALITKTKKAHAHVKESWKYFLLLGVGILVDLISFYVDPLTSDIVFTILAFVLYVIIMFITNILETTQKAYTDPRTGLANKTRWNEVVSRQGAVSGGVGVIMLDLNGLKRVNDTLGHEAGDLMIFSFSNILRNTLPSSSLICRWGGDEFTVMITGTTRKKLEEHLDALRTAVAEYNASPGNPPISFAAGSALSTEYPGLGGKELLAIADSQMYLDKQKWYAQTENTV